MRKILLVEDDKFLANLLRLKLEKEGLEVVQAFDGDEAIKKLKEISPDLMLLDIILPGKNGFEVMEEINNDPEISKVPVIIISNLAQAEDVSKGKSLGAIEYFVKSHTDIDELIKKIKALCQKKTKLKLK